MYAEALRVVSDGIRGIKQETYTLSIVRDLLGGWPRFQRERAPAGPRRDPVKRKFAPREKYGLIKLTELGKDSEGLSVRQHRRRQLRILRPQRLQPHEFYLSLIEHGPFSIWTHHKLQQQQQVEGQQEEEDQNRNMNSSQQKLSITDTNNGSKIASLQRGRRLLFSRNPITRSKTISKGTPPDPLSSLSMETGSPSVAQGSPGLHRAIIPKLYSMQSFYPRLYNQILPKYLLSLDGACTAHLYRSLGRLQPPLPERPPRLSVRKLAAQQQQQQPLKQIERKPSMPTYYFPAHDHPNMTSYDGDASPSSTHSHLAYENPPPASGQRKKRETIRVSDLTRDASAISGSEFESEALTSESVHRRHLFETMVLAIGAASAPKLFTLGADVLAAVPGSLAAAKVHDETLWTAWHDACIYYMNAMQPAQLSELALGIGALGLTPSPRWRISYFRAVEKTMMNFKPQQLVSLMKGLSVMMKLHASYQGPPIPPTPPIPPNFDIELQLRRVVQPNEFGPNVKKDMGTMVKGSDPNESTCPALTTLPLPEDLEALADRVWSQLSSTIFKHTSQWMCPSSLSPSSECSANDLPLKGAHPTQATHAVHLTYVLSWAAFTQDHLPSDWLSCLSSCLVDVLQKHPGLLGPEALYRLIEALTEIYRGRAVTPVQMFGGVSSTSTYQGPTTSRYGNEQTNAAAATSRYGNEQSNAATATKSKYGDGTRATIKRGGVEVEQDDDESEAPVGMRRHGLSTLEYQLLECSTWTFLRYCGIPSKSKNSLSSESGFALSGARIRSALKLLPCCCYALLHLHFQPPSSSPLALSETSLNSMKPLPSPAVKPSSSINTAPSNILPISSISSSDSFLELRISLSTALIKSTLENMPSLSAPDLISTCLVLQTWGSEPPEEWCAAAAVCSMHGAFLSSCTLGELVRIVQVLPCLVPSTLLPAPWYEAILVEWCIRWDHELVEDKIRESNSLENREDETGNMSVEASDDLTSNRVEETGNMSVEASDDLTSKRKNVDMDGKDIQDRACEPQGSIRDKYVRYELLIDLLSHLLIASDSNEVISLLLLGCRSRGLLQGVLRRCLEIQARVHSVLEYLNVGDKERLDYILEVLRSAETKSN